MAREAEGGRRTISVAQAATLLGIGRNSVYEGVRKHEIPAIKVGARILIPIAGLEKLLLEGSRRPT
jgi:excisionase family DNA binding protein